MIKRFWTWFRCIKIVKFSDDTYGIRKGWLFYRYWDLLYWDNKEDAHTWKTFQRVSDCYEKYFYDLGTVVEYERTEMTPAEREEHNRIKELEDKLKKTEEELEMQKDVNRGRHGLGVRVMVQ